MKVKYRHASEPDRVKLYDTDVSYERNCIQSKRGISKEEWAAEDLERFERDKEKGFVLEFEVISDRDAERLMNQKLFDFYKNRLVAECGVHGAFRFNVIEYMCGFPEIDPVEMAVALRNDGFTILFDDSSISRGENVRKRKMVERAFAEATLENPLSEKLQEAKVRSGCTLRGSRAEKEQEQEGLF